MNNLVNDSIKTKDNFSASNDAKQLHSLHSRHMQDTTYVMPAIPDSLCYRPTLLMRPKSERKQNSFNLEEKFYTEHFQTTDKTKYYRIGYETKGYQGEPINYKMSNDDVISGLLFFIFAVIAYIFYHSHNTISKQIKELFFQQESTHLTIEELRYGLFLQFSSCIMLGMISFDYFKLNDPDMVLDSPTRYWLLGAFTCIFILYYLLKWISYCFIGWIFVDRNTKKEWIQCYSVNLYLLGFSLFPIVLLITYDDFSWEYASICIIILVILSKLLLFYKALKLFMRNFYGIFYIIPYFCALEIIPLIILIEVLYQTYVILLIKL